MNAGESASRRAVVEAVENGKAQVRALFASVIRGSEPRRPSCSTHIVYYHKKIEIKANL